jgi:hypothetical protein
MKITELKKMQTVELLALLQIAKFNYEIEEEVETTYEIGKFIDTVNNILKKRVYDLL